jgi:hypothetical protein
MLRTTALTILFVTVITACSSESETPVTPSSTGLIINEIVSNNEGVNIDEEGQTEDWIELVNASDTAIRLDSFFIADNKSDKIQLPNQVLEPGALVVLWADDDADDGPLHLPFKISSSGDEIILYNGDDTVIDTAVVPVLEENQAYARFPSALGDFQRCRYTSPNISNPDTCALANIEIVIDELPFSEFDYATWPAKPNTLAINEVAIFPARFIEVKNFGPNAIELSNFLLRLAAYSPTVKLPIFNTQQSLTLPNQTLAPGEFAAIDITATDIDNIGQQEFKEGVVVLFDTRTQIATDVVPFMHWPADGVLSRKISSPNNLIFCTNTTENLENTCSALNSRVIGNRVRGLYTPSDFPTLAQGSGRTDIESVKFVIDLEDSAAVHYTSVGKWPLHYSFVREVIDLDDELDRCDTFENSQFNFDWRQFSVENYFNTETRRYHLGTLSKHHNADISAIEFVTGDAIQSHQIKEAFYLATQNSYEPKAWKLRPQGESQITKARTIEGQLPIVTENAPFQNLVFQGLSPGVAYGTLQFVDTLELDNVSLGNRVIVITNDVPNDINFVGGLITEAFQTPLAHVNILSQSRNTPNMALPNATARENVMQLLGKLVRLEVNASGYTLNEATPEDAESFWVEQKQQKPLLTPRLDKALTELVELEEANLDDLPAIGAKAAQLAEIMNVSKFVGQCQEGTEFDYPLNAFAIPMAHYLEHLIASGAQDRINELLLDDAFLSDVAVRKTSLAAVRDLIMEYDVNINLLNKVENKVFLAFNNDPVRFRSSSNTEDLAEFNGAGLYTSLSAEYNSEKLPVQVAIKTVWASLWNLRAYEERAHSNVDQTQVAMGILIHKAFRNERANGVAVGRNILNPIRSDQFYFNTQAGEASVTNPAPGVTAEQLIYQWPPRTPNITYHAKSSLLDAEPVLSASEVRALACATDAIQTYFQALLNPNEDIRWFTMEMEFKFLGEDRTLLIKQVRPKTMVNEDVPNDCREL